MHIWWTLQALFSTTLERGSLFNTKLDIGECSHSNIGGKINRVPNHLLNHAVKILLLENANVAAENYISGNPKDGDDTRPRSDITFFRSNHTT